ncbi:MAG TPA: efflux RND transporter periplasmic adaptor subunit [Polyangiaceae bacterium]|nr:efflux RND transporter periplasmic adaptor subunit [Polyangiaceae bacterium]
MLRDATESAAKRPGLPTTTPAPVAPLAPLPATAELEQELAKAEGGKAWIRKLAIWAGVVGLVGAGVVWRIQTRPPPQPKYVLSPITQGDVVESVQSTGTVQPLTQVQVGAQISGRIAKVFVDFNSVVKKGDVLAEIDPTLLGATVEQSRAQAAAAEAQLGRAQAALATAQVALTRIERLRAENLASQADADQARGQRDVTEAEVAAARAQIIQTKAQLSYSRTNMAYSRIYAPIDGLVVSRNIDPGQTVAASFQAPTLFVIAEDLRRMRILAEIDEADVGKLKEAMTADATVDAFAGEVFHGKVSQVRYNPNSVQGVVTYLAVVDVDNPDMKLRPGMTATVTVKTREAKGVLRLPNAALRYRPTPPNRVEAAKDGVEFKPEPPPEPLAHGKGRIYLLTETTLGKEKASSKVIEVGITDGINTEVRTSELALGAKVVTDETDADDKKKGPRLF